MTPHFPRTLLTSEFPLTDQMPYRQVSISEFRQNEQTRIAKCRSASFDRTSKRGSPNVDQLANHPGQCIFLLEVNSQETPTTG